MNNSAGKFAQGKRALVCAGGERKKNKRTVDDDVQGRAKKTIALAREGSRRAVAGLGVTFLSDRNALVLFCLLLEEISAEKRSLVIIRAGAWRQQSVLRATFEEPGGARGHKGSKSILPPPPPPPPGRYPTGQ